ncbi:hypothetical protein DFJ73DRAFT_764181 [Zopfochytrium polystomum]|nr:hypothetical protein DFJ73DRAFT_764181 [Zopfochytrium polystomum]
MKKAGASEQAAEKQVPKQPSNQPIAKKDNTSESVAEIISITSMTKKAAEFPSIEAELEDDEESCWEDFFPGPGRRLAVLHPKESDLDTYDIASARLLELISDNSGAHLLVRPVELTSKIQSIIREISSVTNILNAWMNVTFINYPEVPTRQNKSKDLHPFTTLERRLQEEDNLASSNKKQRSEREDEA